MNKLNVLYEDNHVIVVEKKANILSQADATKDIDLLSMVKQYIKEKYKKPGNVYLGLVHRLDRPVGGIMVFARTSKAASRLTEAMKKNHIKKIYLAVVRGKLEKEEDTWVDYLKKEEDGNTIITSQEDGKYAELHYRVLDYHEMDDCSLVEIQLKTGRHHQIRVQFASRGHCLCGDQRYGRVDHTQIALYAYQLEFVHPVTKELLKFEKKPTDNEYLSTFTM